MPNLFEDIKTFLPKYLSPEEGIALFQELKAFPKNLDKRIYSSKIKQEPYLYQGDGFLEIEIPNYIKKDFVISKGVLISNTCDVSLDNTRFYQTHFVFCPIFDLKKYKTQLESSCDDKEKVKSHIDSIRDNKATTFFFLPSCFDVNSESFIKFDCIYSLPVTNELYDKLKFNKLYSLSNYGFYLFLLKLSIHFTRVQEAVSRS